MDLNSMRKEKIVIKLSGSLFNFEDSSFEKIKSMSLALEEISNFVQPIVIAGGGRIARHYINTCRKFGADESSLDLIGIDVSRLNAKMLISALEDRCYPLVPKTLDDVMEYSNNNKIVISGGLHPGQSTNATSALIAEKVKASLFINATDVDGIYDSDPNTNKNANKFYQIKINDFIKLLINESSVAGTYDLMDIVALKVIERSKIKTRVVLSDPSILKQTIIDKMMHGTEITLS